MQFTPVTVTSTGIKGCIVALLLVSLLAPAHAQELDSPAALSADSIERNSETGLIKARGNVKLEYKDKTLFGDAGEFDMANHRGLMEGNVLLKLPTGNVKASRMEFDTNTATGTMDDADGLLSEKIAFTARKIERVDESLYLIEGGTVTSCLEENPEWLFRSEHIKVQLEEIASFRDVTFRFYDVPIFYSPYWFAPAVTKRKSGFLLPEIGFSSTNGAFFNNQLFWAISEQDDATVSLDLMGLRGQREGLEYRYAFAERTSGQFNVDYIEDRKLNKDLWRVNYDHRHMFANGIDSRARVDAESDTSYSKEFDTGLDLGGRRYTDSFLNFDGGTPDLNLSLLTRGHVTIEKAHDETFTVMPEIALDRMPNQILGTDIVGDFHATATSFQQDIKGQSPKENYSLNRFDTRATLALPYTPMKTLNVTPWVSGRSTYYSRNATDDKAISTEYFSAGLYTEGPRIFKLFDAWGRSFKHTVTPKLDFTYMPGYDIDGRNRQNVLQFDALDRSDPLSAITLSLVNRVHRKASDGGSEELVWLNLIQSYDYREATRPGTDQRPFSALTLDLNSRPADWLLFNTDMTYNHYDGQADTINNELGVKINDSFYAAYDRRYTRAPETKYSSGLIGYHFNKWLTTEFSLAYDEAKGETTNATASIGYRACCWGIDFSFSTRDRTEELSDGSIRRQTEHRFYVNFILTGIGSLGEKPQHSIGRKL